MQIKIYTKYNQILNCKKIEDKIPIFATQKYADFLKKIKNYKTIWFESKENNSHYIIPFAVMKKGFFKKGMFLTAVNSLGSADTIELEKEFLNELVKYIIKNKLCDWIQQSPNWAIFNTYPDSAVFTNFGTYRIDLQNKTEEELFKVIRRKDRQDINKAMREKVVIEKTEKYFDDSIYLIQNTLNKARITSFTNKQFWDMYRFFENNFMDYTAYLKNIPQSSVVFLKNSFATYAMYAGTKKNPARGATSLLYWEAIKESKKRGIKYFDFVGARINPDKNSKQYRIQKFKAHFGSEMKEGYLWKYKISKTKYFKYIAIIRIRTWVKLKKVTGDIIDQEIKRLSKI